MSLHFEAPVSGGAVRGQVRGESGPIVVLENGLSITRYAWEWVIRSLETQYRVLTYDRLGTGLSDASVGPFDARTSALRLKQLVDQVIPGEPFLLVGYSFGGIITREFVGKYPEVVQGWLLVDPSGTDYSQAMKRQVARNARLLHFFNRLGTQIMPLLKYFNVSYSRWVVEGLPNSVLPCAIEAAESAKHLRGSGSEWRQFAESSWQAAKITNFQKLPLTVISAEIPFNSSWNKVVPEMHASHERLSQASGYGEWRIIPGANHMTILLENRFAEQVAQEVELLSARLT